MSINAVAADIIIRAATQADIPDITTIYAHAVKHGTASFEIEPPTAVEMMTRQKTLLDGGFPYIIAEANGTVAGYAYAGPYRPRVAYRHTVEDSVYVNPRYMRRGIGHLLLTELIARAEARGFRQMIAVIGDSRQTASIELHRRLGFALIGTLTNIGFKHGRWLDTVLMQRSLGHGADTAP